MRIGVYMQVHVHVDVHVHAHVHVHVNVRLYVVHVHVRVHVHVHVHLYVVHLYVYNRFRVFISFYCKTTIGQGISEVCNIATGYMHVKVFSEVYCDRVYFLCAERFETGSGFDPPPPPSPGTPYPVEI